MQLTLLLGISGTLSIIMALYLKIGTRMRLRKHTLDWNKIKMEVDGDVDDAYLQYIEGLMLNRHWILGACFPRK